MPQLSLYLNESTLKKIETAAKINNVSISKWVGETINNSLNNAWPADYFNLFGSLKDKNFKRPVQVDFNNDAERESL